MNVHASRKHQRVAQAHAADCRLYVYFLATRTLLQNCLRCQLGACAYLRKELYETFLGENNSRLASNAFPPVVGSHQEGLLGYVAQPTNSTDSQWGAP